MAETQSPPEFLGPSDLCAIWHVDRRTMDKLCDGFDLAWGWLTPRVRRVQRSEVERFEAMNGISSVYPGEPTGLKCPRQGVYFISCGEFIKIGISGSVPNRLGSMRVDNPYRLDPLGFIQCEAYSDAEALEAALHLEFAAFRHQGEWFTDAPQIRDAVRLRAQPWPRGGRLA